ncbi:MAG: hypothetical protein QM813_04885 [Verrucomicrobiota bacterium]
MASEQRPTIGTAWPGCAICQRMIAIRLKPNKKEGERRESVLDADDLVIDREDILLQKPGSSMVVHDRAPACGIGVRSGLHDLVNSVRFGPQ